jgi:uncharacterized protein
MLTPEMQALIERNTIGLVATVTPDGRPAVSPKGTSVILDTTTIVFGDIRSPGTVRNIKSNPAIEINYIDVFSRMACRVSGRAIYVARTEAQFASYLPHFQRWPALVERMRGFVVVTVGSAQLLRSPVYDVGAIESDLRAYWLKHYIEQGG